MSAAEKIDLSGKDWFTEAEAAHYCGLSLSQFRDHPIRARTGPGWEWRQSTSACAVAI